jgi:hypothetical protein
LALSEVAWTKQRNRSWKSFHTRAFTKGVERLKAQNIHYRH